MQQDILKGPKVVTDSAAVAKMLATGAAAARPAKVEAATIVEIILSDK